MTPLTDVTTGRVTKWDAINSAAKVYESAPAGFMQQFGRVAGGPIASYINLSADGVIAGAPAICYGYIVTTIMSANVSSIYDNATAASGTVLFTIPASHPVGVYIFPVGVIAVNGLYFDIGATGTVNFLFAPTV